ncbi:hypothetical protein JY97_10045 [Alkalispirochaeta odontotermitis]|nr:hypothetical protein JY97_10045 [Alkalispirochaeta odontotermitis]
MIPTHVTVLSDEVLRQLAPPRPDALIVDGTLGEGGHAVLFLKAFPRCRVIGIDADRIIGKRAQDRLAPWSDRFRYIRGWTDEVLENWGNGSPDVILMDLGVSTYHFKDSRRGFSFRLDEPLDMRLDTDNDMDASTMVNSLGEDKLAELISNFGEERFGRRIAQGIVRERLKSKIRNSKQLAAVVVKSIPLRFRHGKIHVATKTFQALRIAVNSELDRLSRLLRFAPSLLGEGGRLGIISFHSLEDRLVKSVYLALDSRFGGEYRILTRKPLKPCDEEIKTNPSSRGAKFRVLEKSIERISR